MARTLHDGGRFPHITENLGRTEHKHRTDHHQQEHREHQHDLLGCIAQIATDNLGLVSTIVAHRQHAGEIVMNRTCKDTPQHYPQISHRTKHGTHDGTEDRPRTGNVQKLDHKNLPWWQHQKIHTISLSNGWCHTVVGTEYTLHESSVEHVTQNKSHKAQYK